MLGVPFHVTDSTAIGSTHAQSGMATTYTVGERDGTKLPVGTVLPAYGIITDLFVHQPWPHLQGTPGPTVFAKCRWLIPVQCEEAEEEEQDQHDEKRESKEEKRQESRSRRQRTNRKRRNRRVRFIQEYDQRLPLLECTTGHHEWQSHPFTPLRLAYASNILFMKHPHRAGVVCAIDLRRQCPSPIYPP
jgi:hypothetical protein